MGVVLSITVGSRARRQSLFIRVQNIAECSSLIFLNTFLPAFRVAFKKTFTPENIRAGFRGAGLVPHDPDVVLSKLDVQLRTPTPPAPGTIVWEAQTPRNAREIEAQYTLIRNRIQNY
jgi:hypothetical protein